MGMGRAQIREGVPQTGFSIPLVLACPLGPSAARTGRVSYTFSSSLPALSLSAASHIKVSGVLPLVIPLSGSTLLFSCHGFFWPVLSLVSREKPCCFTCPETWSPVGG